nr:MAG TPA: hypothetical protein [Caudoviricetes sp.]
MQLSDPNSFNNEIMFLFLPFFSFDLNNRSILKV